MISEELKQAAQEYTEKGSKCQDEMDAFKAGAEWLGKQMIKDDTFLVAIGDAYVDWIDGGINTNDENPADYIRNKLKNRQNNYQL